jgi:hypothetical protein
MPSCGRSACIAERDTLDSVFAASDAVAEAKLAWANAREALARADEVV